MSASPMNPVSNHEINKGSILLLFNDADTEIVRSWRIGRTIDSGTTPPKAYLP